MLSLRVQDSQRSANCYCQIDIRGRWHQMYIPPLIVDNLYTTLSNPISPYVCSQPFVLSAIISIRIVINTINITERDAVDACFFNNLGVVWGWYFS